MQTLIVTAHPDPDSLTNAVARRLQEALRPSAADVADLAAEGFDPRFTAADRNTFHVGGDFAPDVAREHERLDRATDLVLVFPVFWWSMPALLKGWIDRVFVNGWAMEFAPGTGIVRKLGHLTIHLVPVAGDDAGVYDRHGYGQAMRAQIEHGIVEYCGARPGVTAFLHDSEGDDASARAAAVDEVVERVRAAVVAGR